MLDLIASRLKMPCGKYKNGIRGRLLEHFGSVESVMKASTKDLQAIEGIGKGKAEDKIRALEDVGVRVSASPADIGATMKEALAGSS